MNETTRAKALSALDGMREIVRREMLVQGEYVEQDITSPQLSGAICGGRKHCAVGSLWVGAGVKYEKDYDGWITLPGVASFERPDFLRPRHGLRVAYDAINRAAQAFADKNGIDLEEMDLTAPIEALFEGHCGNDLTKSDLLKIISAAKREIKAAA